MALYFTYVLLGKRVYLLFNGSYYLVVCPVIQTRLSIFGRDFSVTLVSRRSRHFAGTRYDHNLIRALMDEEFIMIISIFKCPFLVKPCIFEKFSSGEHSIE